ncbi:MAG: ATP synthase subunit I [Ostreibacterium sp.]
MIKKSITLWIIFIMLFTVLAISLSNHLAFFYGTVISLCNIALYYAFFVQHKGRVARYPEQALVIVVTTTSIRFLLVGSLLIVAFTTMKLEAQSILLGFVLGQLFFLIHQLVMVVEKDGK